MATVKAKLHELRRTKQALKNEYKTIVQRDIDGGDDAEMPEADAARLSAIEAELTALDARVARVETALDMDAETAEPVADTPEAEKNYTLDSDGRMTPHGWGEKQAATAAANDRLKGKGFAVARFAMGIHHAKQGGQGLAGAAAWMERRFGDKAVAKALNTAGVATGGALIPQDFSSEFIELLRAETVIRKLNPTIIPMPLGNMTIPRLAGGATAGYQGELDDMTSSQETFDDLQLNAKKLTALVPVSNDLIRRAPIGVEALVRDDMVQTVARREDLAFLLGDGSGGSPIGLLNLAASAMKLTVPAFTALDNTTILTAAGGVLQTMKLLLETNFSRMIRPAWIFTPSTASFLELMRDGVGNYIYKDEMQNGRLFGIPFAKTMQLPTNLSTFGGNVGSYIFLVDFADVILAETYNLTVDATDVGSYKDAGGNSVSTFTRDQTAFRIIEEHDFNIRHQASVAVAVIPSWYPTGFTPAGGSAFYLQAPSGDSSAAPSTWGTAAPTGSNNPANVSANVPGGLLPGRP